MHKVDTIRTLPVASTALLAVCRKCGKKLGGGFGRGGKQRLAKVLRRELGGGKGKRASIRIVETGCMGICPRRAVVVADGGTPGRLLIVPAGADVDSVTAALAPTLSSMK